MTKLFDKISSTTTSVAVDGVVDSTKSWAVDQFKDWFVVISGVEYKITSNTETKLFFSNSISGNHDYEISFVGRSFMLELESDLSDTTKIPDALILKKYNQANTDIHNKIFANLKLYATTEFDPMENILNLICMQQCFAYYLLSKIYQDLSINQDSFEAFKGYNMYEKSFNDSIKDSLSMIQLDINKNGEADVDEIRHPVSSSSFMSR